jgi:hypothetical protein
MGKTSKILRINRLFAYGKKFRVIDAPLTPNVMVCQDNVAFKS